MISVLIKKRDMRVRRRRDMEETITVVTEIVCDVNR